MRYDLEELLREKDKVKPSKELDQAVLQSLEEGTSMKKKKLTTKAGKVAAAILAGVLATGGIAYAATQLWNQDVAEKFGVKDKRETMQELNDQGFAEIPTSTEEAPVQMEDKDIKVKVLQTLADERTVYIYFEVDFGEQYKVVESEREKSKKSDGSEFCLPDPSVMFYINGSADFSYSGGAYEVKDDHTVTYAYHIFTEKELEKDTKIKVDIDYFEFSGENGNERVFGNWEVDWSLSKGNTKRIYTLNKEITINDIPVTLKTLELTPFSCKLEIDSENYDKVFNLEAIAKETKDEEFKTDENGNYIIVGYVDDEKAHKVELNEDEGLLPVAELTQLFVEDKLFTGADGMRSSKKNGELSCSFTEVLDLDKVTAFRFAGQKISLDEFDYETKVEYANE